MKRAAFAALLLLLPLLAGCLGGVPLDKYCYVLDLGVERGDSMPYRFVFLLNEDTAGSEEEGGDKGQVSMVSAEERSLFAAIDALAGALPAQLSFERTTLLAFSRELAEAGEIVTVTDGALSRLKIRQNVRVIVVEGDLRDAFQGLVSEGDPSMNRLKTNVRLFEENYGYVEDWGLHAMREAFANETGDALLPYAGRVGGPLQPDIAGGQAAAPCSPGSGWWGCFRASTPCWCSWQRAAFGRGICDCPGKGRSWIWPSTAWGSPAEAGRRGPSSVRSGWRWIWRTRPRWTPAPRS